MKKFLFLFLLLAAVARADEIALPDGRVLHHAKVAKFYAGEFVIEHDGGIAHVPWVKMAPEFQEQYPFDLETADREKTATESKMAEQKDSTAQQKADQQERERIAALPKVLVYGKILQVKDDFVRIDCAVAKLTHPSTPVLGVAPSEERDIYVPRELQTQNWKFGDVISLIAREDGTFTYTTIQGQVRTVPRITHWEPLPEYAVVVPSGELIHLPTDGPRKPLTPVAARGTTQTPELTMKRGW